MGLRSADIPRHLSYHFFLKIGSTIKLEKIYRIPPGMLTLVKDQLCPCQDVDPCRIPETIKQL